MRLSTIFLIITILYSLELYLSIATNTNNIIHKDKEVLIRSTYSTISRDRLRIGCVGDSLTKGTGAHLPREGSYPAKLREHLGSFFDIMPFAFGGTQITSFCPHPYIDTPAYNESINFNAHFIILQFGTNDAKNDCWEEEMFTTDYINIIKTYQHLPTKPTVFICIPPPYYSNTSLWGIQGHVINNILPRLISIIAQHTGAVLIDNFNLFGGIRLTKPEFYFNSSMRVGPGNLMDGIHLNDQGYHVMAKNIAEKILSHLS
mmetsp:Transcript_40694/g.41552  ORF Transcript_40694/g.41552 Transcript_40694/m.41552 type:complete len:260 (+) Transcript_40694:114-893(+)